MGLPTPIRHSLCFLIMILLIIPKSASQPAFIFAFCSNLTSFAPNSQYETNLKILFNSLSTNVASNQNGFYNKSIGNGADTVHGLYLCRGDQNTSSCMDCLSTATRADLPRKYCSNKKDATIWYDQCMVRYSDKPLVGRMEQYPFIFLFNTQNITGNQTQFGQTLGGVLSNISDVAAEGGSGKKFATDVKVVGNGQKLYSLGQCTPDLSDSDCKQCLRIAAKWLPISTGGRVLMPSCNIRYEIYPFFKGANVGPSPPGSDLATAATNSILGYCLENLSPSECSQCIKNQIDALQYINGRVVLRNCKVTSPLSLSPSSNSTGITHHHPNSHVEKKQLRLPILISISMLIAILMVVFGIWFYLYKRKASIETPNSDVDEIKTMESLQFDLKTIRDATRNFSANNKLGEGGFGEVYKGTLKGGQEIAVKRLSKGSKQGVSEFKTEVLLVAKLQHKNLVKLMGFCFGSREKILIYEYLRNRSLDHFLFDPVKKLSLDWQIRFKVVIGIARGLLYLHEDSRLKIIHRDLKPSNILLNDDMNPKISDFGVARLFGVDQTQDDTNRIVGTYGYMAPEYATTGHFSVKSDVYRFGIIVLEIVSGRKNRIISRPRLEEALLYHAWKLWNEGNALGLVDPTLGNKYPLEEVAHCIHIALLCIQENPTERPRMTTIVAALNDQSISLPMPKAPNFVEHSSVNGKMTSINYTFPIDETKIGYSQEDGQDGSPCLYSGIEEITNMHPR